ncbi:hypothetical protein EDM68_01510 [Candidatus Uhrbacteria bacterium]|nr:MAG: hypothetical protein EDM68_01510 [Candidatus Uhrbacteria bacterium]
MRILFACLMMSAMVAGCYEHHGLDGMEPPPVPMGDAGFSMPTDDAGLPVIDGGPMVEPDADVPSEPVLVVDPFYSGWRTPPARQDMGTADIRVTALRDVEWDGGIWFQISTETPGCMVRGSAGTEYFRDLKVRNTDTGETMMGPVSIPGTEPPGSIATGFFRIGEGDVRRISAGTTLRFAVTMDLSSAEDAPGEFMGCTYAVHTGAGTIIDPSAVRLVGGERLRSDQIGGDNEASYSGFTVDVAIPEFDIRADNLRSSTILVAGGDVWQNVAQYRVGPDESIASFILNLDGDAADIREVAIAADGYVLGTGRFPSGSRPVTGIRPSEPFVTPSDSSRIFQVWVKIPELLSNAATMGVRDGVPISGDFFRVGISGVERYIGSALVTSGFDPIYGNEFVIRKSRPTFTRQTLSTTTIVNGTDQDLYRFQVSADAAGSISLSQISMQVLVHTRSGYGEVCNMRLRRGFTDLPPDSYTIIALEVDRSGSGAVYESPCVYGRAGSGRVIIRFTDEEIVSGSGNSYTLHGTVNGFEAGDSIDVSFGEPGGVVRPDNVIVTGYIVPNTHVSAIDVSPYGMPDTAPVWSRIGASIIWSDLSEVPHGAMFGRDGGSRDWTNGYLIEDLTQTQTLSR